MICGLLGKTLSHSYSPLIHSVFGSYPYKLFECEPENLQSFLHSDKWNAINVTVPYKKEAALYCDELSETAHRLGSVNTIIKKDTGALCGYNTDYYGFEYMLNKLGADCAEKKALVFGSGGASVTVCDCLHNKGACITVISRTGENNYYNISRHYNADIIVNTTPLGMYPDCGKSPVDLKNFKRCSLVLDIVYNPARTALLLQAEQYSIKNCGGLYMLAAQAKRSSELFCGNLLPESAIEQAANTVKKQMLNIVLIGMPGCGKSTIAKMLGEQLCRPVFDIDEIIKQRTGMEIERFFSRFGEEKFRELETEILREVAKNSGAVISTGGGCVTKNENYALLHQNGIIYLINRDISKLETANRPLSQSEGLRKIYEQRARLYKAFADIEVDNNHQISSVIKNITEAYK